MISPFFSFISFFLILLLRRTTQAVSVGRRCKPKLMINSYTIYMYVSVHTLRNFTWVMTEQCNGPHLQGFCMKTNGQGQCYIPARIFVLLVNPFRLRSPSKSNGDSVFSCFVYFYTIYTRCKRSKGGARSCREIDPF